MAQRFGIIRDNATRETRWRPECLFSAYNGWLGAIARRYRQSQIKAATAVNVEMLKFYWSLGADVARLERHQPWGSKFMHRVSEDLKCWMPGAKCFSRVNLYYMVRFFKLYVPAAIVQQLAEQIDGRIDRLQGEGSGDGAICVGVVRLADWRFRLCS